MSIARTTVIAPDRRHAPAIGSRRAVLILIAVAGLWAAWELALDPRGLAPDGGGLRLAGRFLAAAVSPALTYEAPFVPEGTDPLVEKIVDAAGATVVFAAAATSLSLAAGAAM